MDLDTFMNDAFRASRKPLEDLLKRMDIRFCSKCGKAITSGFYAGDDNYCSEACRPYSDEEWADLYDNGNNDYYYWTEYREDEDGKVLAASYNKALENHKKWLEKWTPTFKRYYSLFKKMISFSKHPDMKDEYEATKKELSDLNYHFWSCCYRTMSCEFVPNGIVVVLYDDEYPEVVYGDTNERL